MKRIKKSIGIITAAALALSLSACAQQTTVTFDTERPWHDGNASYEKLDYAVAIYDTTTSTSEDKRVLIASGALSYELKEKPPEGSPTYTTTLDMSFSVTYNETAAEADRGKTDTITSNVEFHNDSLSSSYMTKQVDLADRDGLDNLSYSLEADYFGKHIATRVMNEKERSMSIPQSTYCDNEMMIYLARATGISRGATTNFYLCNIFDSFLNGSLTNYTMAANADDSFQNVKLGKWIEPLVVVEEEEKKDEPETQADGDETDPDVYELPCYRVSISINADKHGPPYRVYYSSKDIKSDGKTHKKVPVKITYAEYTGSAQTRITEYTLTSLAFEKE